MTTLPKRTPDPAHTLAGAFQAMVNEYINLANQVAPFLPRDIREEMTNHVGEIHTKALRTLMEVGERVEDASSTR